MVTVAQAARRLRRLAIGVRDRLMPVEGEEWLVGIVALVVMLGALRHHLEPWLMPPAPESLPDVVQPERVGLLDVNAASVAELELLPGIGPRLAARIADLRSERGGFEQIEELLAVRGIGPATLARIAPALRVGPAAAPGRPAVAAAAPDSFRDTSATHSGEVLR